MNVDGACHGATSLVFALLRALHLVPLLVAVGDGNYPGIVACQLAAGGWGNGTSGRPVGSVTPAER